MTSSSGTSISSTAVSVRPTLSSAAASSSACATLRGKPSGRKPSLASSASSASRITPMISSSGTRLPASMCALAWRPSSVPSLTAARRMLPVAKYGRPKSCVIRSAWVPWPAPGGPTRMRFSSDTGALAASLRTGASRPPVPGRSGILLEEAFVVAHHQLGLELLHGVEGHADDDQQRGSAELERLRRTGEGDHDRRQRGDRGEVECAREREAREDPVEELGRRPARSHPRDEAAVLLQVLG